MVLFYLFFFGDNGVILSDDLFFLFEFGFNLLFFLFPFFKRRTIK